MTTWKEKMAADTARYEHLPNFITNVVDRAERAAKARRECTCDRDTLINDPGMCSPGCPVHDAAPLDEQWERGDA